MDEYSKDDYSKVVMTREKLWNAMVSGAEVAVYDRISGAFLTGFVQSIEKEDGSGQSFNVVMAIDGAEQMLYVRF